MHRFRTRKRASRIRASRKHRTHRTTAKTKRRVRKGGVRTAPTMRAQKNKKYRPLSYKNKLCATRNLKQDIEHVMKKRDIKPKYINELEKNVSVDTDVIAYLEKFHRFLDVFIEKYDEVEDEDIGSNYSAFAMPLGEKLHDVLKENKGLVVKVAKTMNTNEDELARLLGSMSLNSEENWGAVGNLKNFNISANPVDYLEKYNAFLEEFIEEYDEANNADMSDYSAFATLLAVEIRDIIKEQKGWLFKNVGKTVNVNMNTNIVMNSAMNIAMANRNTNKSNELSDDIISMFTRLGL